jgi:SAM-dependent methyltransferase
MSWSSPRKPLVDNALPVLCCPSCEIPLMTDGPAEFCTSCRKRWPVLNGVTFFGGSHHGQHRLTADQQADIAQVAITEGWQVALHDRLRDVAPKAYRCAVDPYRAHWRFLLPLSSSSRVLDLNAGLGAATFSLAETCGAVVAADASGHQAAFVAVRARQSGMHNILSLRLGLDQLLPFAPGSFDGVVLADGLSWIASAAEQRQLVDRIHRILCPGGTLLLADMNRVGPAQLAGASSRPGTRSVGGYARLLRRAGFDRLRTYALLPSHDEPFFLIPLDQRAPFAFFLREIVANANFGPQLERRGLGLLFRIVRAVAETVPATVLTTMLRSFVPGVAIAARRHAASASAWPAPMSRS